MGKLATAVRSASDRQLVNEIKPKIGGFDERTRREDMAQIAAISAFEGLTPSPAYQELRDRYASGEISIKEFRKEIDSRWKQNG